MILFTIFTALFQISLNSALDPHLKYLPKSMDAEERRLLAEERGEHLDTDMEAGNGHGEKNNGAGTNGTNGTNGTKEAVAASAAPATAAPHKKPNMLTKFLKPHIYCDYATMRRLVPKEIAPGYDAEVEEEAYFNPAITERMPLLWIPRDPMGLSRKEVADTGAVAPITDEGAFLDEKNKVVWDAEDGRPPIYQEKIDY